MRVDPTAVGFRVANEITMSLSVIPNDVDVALTRASPSDASERMPCAIISFLMFETGKPMIKNGEFFSILHS